MHMEAYCAVVVANMFGVSVADFLKWNPGILNGANYTLSTCFVANETQYCAAFYNQSREFSTLPF